MKVSFTQQWRALSLDNIGKSLPDILRAWKNYWHFSGFPDRSGNIWSQAWVRCKLTGCRLALEPCQELSEELLMISYLREGKIWSCWPSQQKPSESMRSFQKGLKLNGDLSNNIKKFQQICTLCVWIATSPPGMQQRQVIRDILDGKRIAKWTLRHLVNRWEEAVLMCVKKCHTVNISGTWWSVIVLESHRYWVNCFSPLNKEKGLEMEYCIK